MCGSDLENIVFFRHLCCSLLDYHVMGLGNQYHHTFSFLMYFELRAIIIELSHQRFVKQCHCGECDTRSNLALA
jgi:hypothetical protein